MAEDEEFWNEDNLIDRDEDQYGQYYYQQDFDSDEAGREQVDSRDTSTLKNSVSASNGAPFKKATQPGRRRTIETNKHNFKQLYGYPKPKARPRPAETSSKQRQPPVFVSEMLGEKRFEVDTLRNEISDLKFEITKLKDENRTLRNQLRLQEKSLQKLDHEESNFGGYMKKFQDDLRVQQELSRRYREDRMRLEHILKERDAEMDRNRAEMARLKDIIAADGLDERSALANKLQAAEHERAAIEKRLAEVQKHKENLEKNHKYQLQSAIKRQKEADRRADQLQEENRKLRFELAEKTKMLEIQNIYSKRHANILRIPHYLPELNDSNANDTQKTLNKFEDAEESDSAEKSDEEQEREQEQAEAEANGNDGRHSDASARIKFDLEEEMDEPYRPPEIETAVQQSMDDASAEPAESHVNGRPRTGTSNMRQQVQEPQPVVDESYAEVRPKTASRSASHSREQTEEQLKLDNEKKKRLLAALKVIEGGESVQNGGNTNGREHENANGGDKWDFLTAMSGQDASSHRNGLHLLDSLEFAPPPAAQSQSQSQSQSQALPPSNAKPPKPSSSSSAGSLNSPTKGSRARLTPKEYSFVRAIETMQLGLSAAEEHSENNFNARYNVERGGKLLPKRMNQEKQTSISFEAEFDRNGVEDNQHDHHGAHNTDYSARGAFSMQQIAKSLDTDDVEEINM